MPGIDLSTSWDRLDHRIASCSRCPRLRDHCHAVAVNKRRAFAHQDYWGRPVPGFGDRGARIWIIGLAPAAHGANRTGRMFTGDRSGDFLYAALHRAGLANQPISTNRDDGLALRDVYISAAARCAPPGNKPTPVELSACFPFLRREWDLLIRKRVLLALGRIAWDAALRVAVAVGAAPAARVAFAHGAQVPLGPVALLGSYHVSQQNTFTGRLTQPMFDAVLHRAVELASA